MKKNILFLSTIFLASSLPVVGSSPDQEVTDLMTGQKEKVIEAAGYFGYSFCDLNRAANQSEQNLRTLLRKTVVPSDYTNSPNQNKLTAQYFNIIINYFFPHPQLTSPLNRSGSFSNPNRPTSAGSSRPGTRQGMGNRQGSNNNSFSGRPVDDE